MRQFEDLDGHPDLGHLQRVHEAKLRAIEAAFPGVPADYLGFLGEIGFGGVGASKESARFVIYSGLVQPAFVYGDAAAAALPNVVLLGDDLWGHSVGFDRAEGWRVVEIDPDDADAGELQFVCDSFGGFVRKFLLG
jgi:hypothetical protein